MPDTRVDVVLRAPRLEDLDVLHQLIVESTDGATKITKSSLRSDLFEPQSCREVSNSDSMIEFDHELVKSKEPIVQAILAEVDEKVIGYILYHYHYSPWAGRGSYIDNLYVAPSYRHQGIGHRLVQALCRVSRSENLGKFMFPVGRIDPKLWDTYLKDGAEWYRNDSFDWSVLRINLRGSEE